MCRVAKHVDVEQLGYVAATPRRVLLSKSVANEGTLLVNDGAFFGSRARRPNLSYEIAQALRRRRELDAELIKRTRDRILNGLQH